MRKLFLLIALLILPSIAHATDTTATFGDQNSSGTYRVIADTDGVVTFASDTGINYPYEDYTTGSGTNTLALTECGKTISVSNATFGSKHVLPRATPGCGFSFVANNKIFITVDTVDTSDTIAYSISGTSLDAGDSIKSTGQAGDAVTVFSTKANVWSIKTMKATWTDNSTN